MVNKIKASIIGGSGYAGGELLRILNSHPNVEIVQITSRKYNRFPVTIAHPNMRGVTNLKFSDMQELEQCDILFSALPHGKSQEFMEDFFQVADKVIDLGADFRLRNVQDYQNWYGDHTRDDLIKKFVYGVTEVNRENIESSNYVACGGCEATCSILALYPLYKNGLIETDNIIVDAKIGSSAAGASSSRSSHHPERAGVVRSYKPTMHRHTAEIEQDIIRYNKNKVKVHFSATAIEMVRGILVTIQTFLKEDISESDIWKIYRKEYKNEFFIRLINDKSGIYRFPEPKLLQGTNFCDIGIQRDKRSNRLVVVGAIDNLVKGTAGQAVQDMNILFNLDEKTGLRFSGLHPV
jgi:N-acetyl-gamma-glutamyl-phosphate/LysW-gamma-L-alpha-aminoadipyl-6-phosphate reductase